MKDPWLHSVIEPDYGAYAEPPRLNTQRHVLWNPRGLSYRYAFYYSVHAGWYYWGVRYSANGTSWSMFYNYREFETDWLDGFDVCYYEAPAEGRLYIYVVWTESDGSMWYRKFYILDAAPTMYPVAAAQRIFYDATGHESRHKPSICLDRDGHLWVVYERRYNGEVRGRCIVSQSAYPGGTVTMSSEYEFNAATYAGEQLIPAVNPWPSGITPEALITWQSRNQEVEPPLLRGLELSYSPGPPETWTPGVYDEIMQTDYTQGHSTIITDTPYGFTAHNVFGYVQCVRWVPGTGGANLGAIVHNQNEEKVITKDTGVSPNLLYCFYGRSNTTVYWKTSTDGITWSSENSAATYSEQMIFHFTGCRIDQDRHVFLMFADYYTSGVRWHEEYWFEAWVVPPPVIPIQAILKPLHGAI